MPKLMNSDSGQGAERAEGTTGRKRGARACVNSVSGEGAENRIVAAEACIDENRGEGAGAANRKSSAGAGVIGESENGAHQAKNKKTASKPASTASAETGERRGHCWNLRHQRARNMGGEGIYGAFMGSAFEDLPHI